MIDKYGNEQTIGSKEFEEYLHHRMDKEFCNDIACGDMNKELALQYANEFFGYALDLQEEVKRLREIIGNREWTIKLCDEEIKRLREVIKKIKDCATINAHIYWS